MRPHSLSKVGTEPRSPDTVSFSTCISLSINPISPRSSLPEAHLALPRPLPHCTAQCTPSSPCTTAHNIISTVSASLLPAWCPQSPSTPYNMVPPITPPLLPTAGAPQNLCPAVLALRGAPDSPHTTMGVGMGMSRRLQLGLVGSGREHSSTEEQRLCSCL